MKSGRSSISQNKKVVKIKKPDTRSHNSIIFNEPVKPYSKIVSPINLISKLKTDEEEFLLNSRSSHFDFKFVDDLFINFTKLISSAEDTLDTKINKLGILKDEFIKKIKKQLNFPLSRLSISSKTPSNTAIIESERYLNTVRHKNGVGSYNLNTSISKSTKASCAVDKKRSINPTPGNASARDAFTNLTKNFSTEIFSLKSYIMKAPKKDPQHMLSLSKPNHFLEHSKSISKSKRQKSISTHKSPSLSIANNDFVSNKHKPTLEETNKKKDLGIKVKSNKHFDMTKIKKEIKEKILNLGKRIHTHTESHSRKSNNELKKSSTNFFTCLNLKSKSSHSNYSKPKSFDSKKCKCFEKISQNLKEKTETPTMVPAQSIEFEAAEQRSKLEDIMIKVYSNLGKNYYHYLNFSYNEFCENSKHTMNNSFFQDN